MGAPARDRRPGGLSTAPWMAPPGALVPAPAVSALGPVSYTRFSQGRGCWQSGWCRRVYPLPVDAAPHRRVSSGFARVDAVLAIGEVADPSRPSFPMNPVGPGWDHGRDQGRWGRGFVPCGRAALLVGLAGGGPAEALLRRCHWQVSGGSSYGLPLRPRLPPFGVGVVVLWALH